MVPPPQFSRVVIVAYNDLGRRIGETHHNARIPDETVDRIRELHEDFKYSYFDISCELNIALTTVRKICAYQRRADTPKRYVRRKAEVVESSKPRLEVSEYVWKGRVFPTYKMATENIHG